MSGPELKRDWIGLRVRTLCPLSNRMCQVPAGSQGKVTSYHRGFAVEFNGCSACGCKARFTQIRPEDLAVVTPVEAWPNTKGRDAKR